MTPDAPLLFIRPRLAFWVESAWTGISSATLQALDEGCYAGTWCFDSAGVGWPILEAALARPPRLLDRLLRWRRVPVRLRLGHPTGEALTAAVDHLREIVHAPGFESEGDLSPEEFEAALGAVQSPAALIELARRAVDHAA